MELAYGVSLPEIYSQLFRTPFVTIRVIEKALTYSGCLINKYE